MLLAKLAVRNILRHRRRSLLTLLSMSGGYILLSLGLSMSEGSYNDIIDLFTQDHTGHVQIHQDDYLERPSLYKTLKNVDQLIAQVEQYPQVISVAPRIHGPALAYGENKTAPAQVIGIDPKREANTSFLAKKVKQGAFITEGTTDAGYFPAMIGPTLAANLKLSLGDELVLISQGIDGSIANDIFEIVAVVGTTESYERQNVYLSLPAMRQFLSMGNQVHELAIMLEKQTQARDFAQEINLKLNSDDQAKNKHNLYAAPWQEVEESFYSSMQADKKGNYVSLGILIVIVSIGVLNTVLMSTLERTREFGVLKAIGTRPFTLFRLILLETFLLSSASCVVGLILALPINYWFEHTGIALPEPIDMGGVLFSTMSGEISWITMGIPAVVVICSALLVSLFPGLRAARISPLQALQAV